MFPLKVGVLATPPQLAGVEPSSGGWRGMDVLEGQLWFGMRSSAARLCPAHTRKKKTFRLSKKLGRNASMG